MELNYKDIGSITISTGNLIKNIRKEFRRCPFPNPRMQLFDDLFVIESYPK